MTTIAILGIEEPEHLVCLLAATLTDSEWEVWSSILSELLGGRWEDYEKYNPNSPPGTLLEKMKEALTRVGVVIFQ